MRDEVLAEEEQADMGHVAATIGAVCVGCAVEMGEDVDVCCAGGVMAWEEGGELRDAFCIGGLVTVQKCRVDIGGVGGFTVSVGDNVGIDAGGVAVLDLDHGVHDKIAGCRVSYLGDG